MTRRLRMLFMVVPALFAPSFAALTLQAAEKAPARTAGGPPTAPDLKVSISGPNAASAGEDIGPLLKLVASNAGSAAAPGTTGTLDPAHGYMIDVVLSKDTKVLPGFATYSPLFSEDVLLQGGRVSNTQDLAPGSSRPYPAGARIPTDTPAGSYYVCAQIDPGNKVLETNETNNTACMPIRVTAKK